VSAFYLAWYAGYLPMIAIALSIFVSIITAATFGSMIPILLHALSLDPKVAAGPVVLMLADIAATTAYLTIAYFLLI
jgi:magnesium transporter